MKRIISIGISILLSVTLVWADPVMSYSMTKKTTDWTVDSVFSLALVGVCLATVGYYLHQDINSHKLGVSFGAGAKTHPNENSDVKEHHDNRDKGKGKKKGHDN